MDYSFTYNGQNKKQQETECPHCKTKWKVEYHEFISFTEPIYWSEVETICPQCLKIFPVEIFASKQSIMLYGVKIVQG